MRDWLRHYACGRPHKDRSTSMCVCFCTLHTGANPLLTNGLGHTAQAYAKEGDVKTILQEWESKVCLTSYVYIDAKFPLLFFNANYRE